jgi:hypothetical protein
MNHINKKTRLETSKKTLKQNYMQTMEKLEHKINTIMSIYINWFGPSIVIGVFFLLPTQHATKVYNKHY